MSFGDSYIRTIMDADKEGQQQRVRDTVQKFGKLASAGDQSAMGEIYSVDPGGAASLETAFANRDKAQAEWDDYIQQKSADVAYSVLSEQDPTARAQRLQSGIEYMTGLTQRDQRLRPVLDKWRTLAQSGDQNAITTELSGVLDRATSYADRLKAQQPKSEDERDWAVLSAGDTGSPAYFGAYHRQFGKERVVVDPVSGMPMRVSQPVPPGLAQPSFRPGGAPSRAPGAMPAPPSLTPAPVSRSPLAPPAPPRAPGTMPLREAVASPPVKPPTGAPQVTLPTLGGTPPMTEAQFADPRIPTPSAQPPAPPPMRPLPMVGADGRPIQPMRDAFGRVIDPNQPTAAERREEAKTNRKSYQEQRADAAKDASNAQTVMQDAQTFFNVNEKMNRKGSGNIGTGGILAIPGAQTVAGAFDSDIASGVAAMNRLVPQSRPPGSGPMSDGDAVMFKAGLFGMDKPYGANRAIAQGLIENSKDTIAYQRFLDLYYKRTGNADEAASLWKQYLEENPIFDRTKPDTPTLNPNREPWQNYFTQRGLIAPTEAPKPQAPTSVSRPDAIKDNRLREMMKADPDRFVPQ